MNRTITALVNLLRTFADELESKAVESAAAENAAAEQPAKRTRGPNKPKETAAAAPTEPTQPAAPAEPEGITLDALKALIAPAVEAGAGVAIKGIITKHGGTKLADIPAANHAAFAADVEALVY